MKVIWKTEKIWNDNARTYFTCLNEKPTLKFLISKSFIIKIHKLDFL